MKDQRGRSRVWHSPESHQVHKTQTSNEGLAWKDTAVMRTVHIPYAFWADHFGSSLLKHSTFKSLSFFWGVHHKENVQVQPPHPDSALPCDMPRHS